MKVALCKNIFNWLMVACAVFSVQLPTAQALDWSSTEDNQDVRIPRPWEIVTDLPDDLREFGRAVVNPENTGLILGLTAMTAAMTKGDYETWQAARVPETHDESLHQFSNLGVSMGDGFFQFSLAGGFFAAGAVFGNNRALRTAAQVSESILATGIVVQLMKHTIGRESPFSSESRTGVWRVFPDQQVYLKDFQKYDAVPSGHLSTATTTFLVIYENYPDQKWIPYVGIPWLGWISYGLVATSIHWWSDFPIAIALGYSMGRIVTRGNRRVPGATQTNSVWSPVLSPTFSHEGDPILQANWSF